MSWYVAMARASLEVQTSTVLVAPPTPFHTSPLSDTPLNSTHTASPGPIAVCPPMLIVIWSDGLTEPAAQASEFAPVDRSVTCPHVGSTMSLPALTVIVPSGASPPVSEVWNLIP